MNNRLLQYVDFHTHNLSQTPEILSIYVLPLNDHNTLNSPFCLGLHPWDLKKESLATWITKNEFLFHHPNCWAVGEIGLDKSKNEVLLNNEDYLIYFFQIAQKFQKPIVLHLVKAIPEFLAFLKHKPQFQQIPIVIHAFHGNLELLKNLLQFNIYFSLGVRELNRVQNNKEYLSQLYSRLLLETDDSINSIQETYQLASQCFEKNLSEIHEKIEHNFKTVFPLNQALFN